MPVYLLVFFAALVTDLIPVVGPPVWTIMVFLVVKYDLNPWLVLLVGVPGSVLGRYGLSLYVSALFARFVDQRKSDEIKFVGERLNGRLWQIWPFVLLYSLLPLSTTALFSAVGLARIRPVQVLPPFFVGKFISDAVMVFTGRYAFHNTVELLYGAFSWQQVIATTFGLAMMGVFLFADWRIILEDRKLRFNFRIWK
jgi:membrane protein YqaA with SNARE-associated domain